MTVSYKALTYDMCRWRRDHAGIAHGWRCRTEFNGGLPCFYVWSLFNIHIYTIFAKYIVRTRVVVVTMRRKCSFSCFLLLLDPWFNPAIEQQVPKELINLLNPITQKSEGPYSAGHPKICCFSQPTLSALSARPLISFIICARPLIAFIVWVRSTLSTFTGWWWAKPWKSRCPFKFYFMN